MSEFDPPIRCPSCHSPHKYMDLETENIMATCTNCRTRFFVTNTKRDPLLNKRQKTHGSFETNAKISQDIKKLFGSYGYDSLGPVQREALDMIALKLSRILSGYQLYKDHWDDIAGYAKLGGEACDK